MGRAGERPHPDPPSLSLPQILEPLRLACAGGDPGAVRSVKARMAAPVFPGDTVVTRMWREGLGVDGRERVVFAVGVEGREGDAITAAAVELGPPLADARL